MALGKAELKAGEWRKGQWEELNNHRVGQGGNSARLREDPKEGKH